MRKLLKSLFLTISIIGLVYVGACVYTKDRTDDFAQLMGQFNFLVKEEPRFVKINNAKGKDEDGYGNYNYTLTSYDKDGNEHPIKFTGMGKLKQGHFLEVTAKGAYVITYKEVFKNDMPTNVYNKLQTE
ncbi:YxeA family protein [Companilactobacillus heilongjiangensis]|uniref:YxeA family protein n=1 Tax=Companilactobacillus heilongjiangensis TaxID=1074467 RepID=A0A0K2LCD8_9LACO|nr:YxeA family protein [Companilactobacillus heilongjiangensis]ALB28967.1 hypothetical protein JP39_06105 [Companilactobacillus heilongjiangensis]